MSRHAAHLTVLSVATILSGCALESDTHVISAGYQPLVELNGNMINGLTEAGLSGTGFAAEALPDSTLTQNGLPTSLLEDTWDDWLNDATHSATHDELMDYIVRCALADTESASFKDSANVTWTWNGEAGLAPSWASRGMTGGEQRMVSSCVIALINKDGTNVEISLRGKTGSPHVVTETEIQDWDTIEGAFFGNIFAVVPVYYSCVHSSSFTDPGNGRVCTLTDVNDVSLCDPIEVQGLCSDVCSSETRTIGNESYTVYYNCVGSDLLTYGEVTTTALDLVP